MNRHFISALSLAALSLIAGCESKDEAAKKPKQESSPIDVPLENDLAAALRELDPGRIIRAIEESPERYPVQYGVGSVVPPGSLAARAGIETGTLVLLRGGSLLDRFRAAPALGKIVWVDSKGEPREGMVEEKIFGLPMEIERNLAAWYVMNGNRRAEWDLHVVGALAVHDRNPQLAARLWEHAERAGYPADSLSNLCRMIIACLLGDAEMAAHHAKAFGPLENAPVGLPFRETDWEMVTAVTGDPTWTSAAMDYYENKFLNDSWKNNFADIADMLTLTARDAATSPPASPSGLADRMRRRSALPELQTSAPWTNNARSVSEMQRAMYAAAKEAQEQDREGFEPVTMAQYPDLMHKSWCGPQEKTRDLDMKIEFTVRPIEVSSPSNYMRNFIVGFANRTMHGGENLAQVPPSARILSVCFGFHTTSEIGDSWITALVPSRQAWSTLSLRRKPYQLSGRNLFDHVPDRRPKPGVKHTLRVVRVGNQAEAILDGRRIALVNVPPHVDDTGVNWFVSGVEVTITSFQVDVLN